tara:strand:- start:213 stop:1319 length:1107 start_codon:yes stop_codon:yes gene_type:complete
MAGILDKKSRIMDVIVTREGRRQIADGNLRATFASFTDSQSFYEHDAVSGSTDPTDRIYFEAFSSPIDQIIFEKDDSGRLIGDIPVSDGTIFGDQIFKHDGDSQFLLVTGSTFASDAEGFVTASINNFKNQQLIGSEKGNDLNPLTFDVSENKIAFTLDNSKPFNGNPNDFSIDIQSAKPLFFDDRLAHLPQFAFLPPVTTKGLPTANFTNVRTSNRQTLTNVVDRIGGSSNLPHDDTSTEELPLYTEYDVGEAFLAAYRAERDRINSINAASSNLIERRTIRFKNTSFNNNIMCQIFEINAQGNDKRLIKLDVVDQGEFDFINDNTSDFQNETNKGHEKKQFFYAGKVFKDDFGVPCFLNIFTIVFD